MASTFSFEQMTSLEHELFVPNLTRYVCAIAKHNSICKYQGVDCITLDDDV